MSSTLDPYKLGFQNKELEKERQKLLILLEKIKNKNIVDSDKIQIRKEIYDNETYNFVNKQVDIAVFKELRERVKQITNGKYGVNINLPESNVVEKRNATITILNQQRNTFIHFEPQAYSTRISDDFDIGKYCLDIINHILSECKINNDIPGCNASIFFLYEINLNGMKKIIYDIKKMDMNT